MTQTQGIYFTQVMTGSEIMRHKNPHVDTCAISIPISSLIERKEQDQRGTQPEKMFRGYTFLEQKVLIIPRYKQFLNQKSRGI